MPYNASISIESSKADTLSKKIAKLDSFWKDLESCFEKQSNLIEKIVKEISFITYSVDQLENEFVKEKQLLESIFFEFKSIFAIDLKFMATPEFTALNWKHSFAKLLEKNLPLKNRYLQEMRHTELKELILFYSNLEPTRFREQANKKLNNILHDGLALSSGDDQLKVHLKSIIELTYLTSLEVVDINMNLLKRLQENLQEMQYQQRNSFFREASTIKNSFTVTRYVTNNTTTPNTTTPIARMKVG